MAETAEEARRRIEAEHRARQAQHPVLELFPIQGQEDDKATQILSTLRPGEPFFVFRAQDILSSFAIEAYLTLVEKFNPTGPQAESLTDALNEFRAWQQAHPQEVKLPD